MKRNNRINLRAASLTAALAFATMPLTPVLFAQAQHRDPDAQQDQQKTQTFTGKIVKTRSGQFALLVDEQTGKGVYLDDQDKAMQYEGKNVKVTGTLEVAKNLVHVTDIQPA